MSRREDAVKAAAAGLQPKSLDLTEYAPARSASRVRSTMRVANDEASFAMGFAVGPITVKGEVMGGDPLAVALLRLKYAEQLSMSGFERALALLLHQHDPVSQTLRAVAAAALIEWVNDRCPKCRSPRGKALQPGPCPACGPVKHADRNPFRVDGEPITHARDRMGFPIRSGARASITPLPGCSKCHGMGRIFVNQASPKGMMCVSCGNSGIVYWRAERRWRAVSELLVQEQKSLGQPLRGLKRENFMDHWHARFRGFIGDLRAADRRMGATIDFRFMPGDRSAVDFLSQTLDGTENHADNRAIESGTEENKEPVAPIERAGCPTAQEPEQPTGEVPPQDS